MSEEPNGDEAEEPAEEAGEETAGEAGPENGDETGADDERKGGRGKLISVIAVALVAVLGAGGLAAYYLGLLDPVFGVKPRTTTASIELGPPVNHELPVIKADLKTGKCRAPLLRTIMVIRLAREDLPRLQTMEVQVAAAVRAYLRNLERQEMVGRAGEEKLREEVTRIINGLMSPAKIHAIIFKEFLVQ